MNTTTYNSDFIIQDGTLVEYKGADHDIVIPDNVYTIAKNSISFICMKCCLSLTIPKNTTYIHPEFMPIVSGFKSIKVDKENKYYSDEGNCLIEKSTKTLMVGTDNSIIPSDGSVTSIGNNAFSNCNFSKFKIPDCVTVINDGAFSFCESLEELIMPEGLTTIGERVFSSCKKLKKIVLPKSVSHIAEGAFSSWRGNIVIKNKEEYFIKDKCLIDKRNKNLISCCGGSSIPSDGSVEKIGYRAFFENRYLKDITLPDGITSVGGEVFGDCKNLKSIVFPNSVTSIGEKALIYCVNLEKVVFGENVSEIGINCFWNIIEVRVNAKRKLKEIVFRNPKGWSIIYHYYRSKELITEEIPEEILSDPTSAAEFIVKKTEENYRGRGVSFKRS